MPPIMSKIFPTSSFHISWIAFVLALLSIALIPVIIWLVDDGRPGWDQMDTDLGIIVLGLACALACLLATFIASIYAVRERKIVLLWMLPSGIVVTIALSYLLVYLIGPFWDPSWM